MQRRKRKAGPVLLMLPMAAWTVLFVGAALAYILILSFCQRAPDGFGVVYRFTLENYAKLANPIYEQVLWKSLALAFQTTLLCLLIGYPFGYMMARAKKSWRGALLLLVVVPFWTNALVRIYGWQILLMNDGPVNKALMALGLAKHPLKLLNTYGAVLLGMVYGLLPFMILSVYSAVERMDWALVEAGRDMGARPWQVFCTVTLPLTAQGVMAGVVLTFVPSMALFFISDLLGGGNYMLVGNLVYNQLLKARDWPFAAAISVALMALTSLILWAYRRMGGKAGNFVMF